MADPKKRLPYNVAGEFFVDNSCINCDTCRQLAPEVFDETGDYSFVYAQPQSNLEKRNALRALLACPTGSIGTMGDNNAREVIEDFPLPIEDAVYYCGFASPKSFGGSSYFLQHPVGNWLIDSPKYLPYLIKKFEKMGGIKYIFLMHRDDVAEAHRYAAHFGAQRIIHRKEISAQPGAEIVIDGDNPIQIFPEFIIIPTPGHTRGHCVMLHRNRFLFTGDHLWWSRVRNHLHASESVCWYDWDEQKRSVARLLDFEFVWILPGHGQRFHAPKDAMRSELQLLVQRLTSSQLVHEETW